MEAWEAYYAGRTLGWKAYHVGSPVKSSDYLDFVRTMDFVLVRKWESYRQISRDQLKEAGFELKATIEPLHSDRTRIGWGMLSRRQPDVAYSALQVYRKRD